MKRSKCDTRAKHQTLLYGFSPVCVLLCLVREHFTKNDITKRFFPSVCSHMSCEITLFQQMTSYKFCMCSHMAGKRSIHRERLIMILNYRFNTHIKFVDFSFLASILQLLTCCLQPPTIQFVTPRINLSKLHLTVDCGYILFFS